MSEAIETPTQTAPPVPAAAVPPPPPPQAVNVDSPRKSPALASVLSAMPGLGQVYVGYYQRGFVHAFVVATIITLLANLSRGNDNLIPFLSISLAFFWLYNIIDAGRRAMLYNQALAGGQAIELPKDFKMPGIGGSILGGVILMAVGFVLLLNTRFDVPLEWIAEWWPVLLIAVGAYLLGKALLERSASGVGSNSLE